MRPAAAVRSRRPRRGAAWRGAGLAALLLLAAAAHAEPPQAAQAERAGPADAPQAERAGPADAPQAEQAGPADAPQAEAEAAQGAEGGAGTPDYGAPMGPEDVYNRGTPRGTAYGFIVAARDGDWERAAAYLDLRQLPRSLATRGPELARQLKQVLDQTAWLDFEQLSPRAEGDADDGLPSSQDRLARIDTAHGPVDLLLQRVPRADDGQRIWQVAASTVARIPALHEEFGPGPLARWLPPFFFDWKLFEIALWQWLGLLLVAGLAWLVAMAISRAVIRLLHALVARTRSAMDDRIVQLLQGPVRLALAAGLFEALSRPLRLAVPVQDLLQELEQLALVVAGAWLAIRLLDLAVLVLGQRLEARGQAGVVPILAPLRRIAAALVLVMAVLTALASLGVNVTAVLAGLGVGGIAVALAAQKTFENLFGGATLFADQPVRVGDFCRFGDRVGTVEAIGLRSTRLRTLDRTVVSVPNGSFSQLELENFAARDRILLQTQLGLRYETTPEQLRYVLARLRELLIGHPRVLPEPGRVRFCGFGAYSLDVEIFAYLDTADWNEFLTLREDLFLRIMDVVEEAGSGFAFPSQTTYLGRDPGLDAERAQHAESEVAGWRERGELPLPNPPEARRRAIENRLDWPPRGSAEAAAAADDE